MKNFLKLFILFFAFLLMQCSEKFEPGETNVKDFAGDWYFQVYSIDGTLLIDYDYKNDIRLLTYNTAGNLTNEIWLDDDTTTFPIKAKLKINGTSKQFNSDFGVNEYIIEEPDEKNIEDGQQIDVEIYDFLLAKIVEGKIMPGAATLWRDSQKAKSDSIYMKIAFSAGTLHWIARKIIKNNDTIIYYEKSSNFFTPGDPLDTFIIQGHRQTGWEVHFTE